MHCQKVRANTAANRIRTETLPMNGFHWFFVILCACKLLEFAGDWACLQIWEARLHRAQGKLAE
jgi:hypothetical protein